MKGKLVKSIHTYEFKSSLGKATVVRMIDGSVNEQNSEVTELWRRKNDKLFERVTGLSELDKEIIVTELDEAIANNEVEVLW